MPRSPLPIKPWHLYDLVPYISSKVSGSLEKPIPYTTYGKTKRDAMTTFKDNHVGDFVLVSDRCEIPVTIGGDGIWFEKCLQI